MSEQALLPPASDASSSFDLAAHAAALGATPKEHYAAPDPEPEPAPEPPPDPEPKAEPGGGSAKGTADDQASARFILDMYDSGVSLLSEALVDDPAKYPASHFAMQPLLKEHAVDQLSKGMAQGGGKWHLPWWVALLVVLLFHGGLTWAAVRSAKREKAERKPKTPPPAPTTAQYTAHHAEPLNVSLQDKNGKDLGSVPQRPESNNMPPCQLCGQPVKRKGRKYCGQSCAGKATRGTKHPKS